LIPTSVVCLLSTYHAFFKSPVRLHLLMAAQSRDIPLIIGYQQDKFFNKVKFLVVSLKDVIFCKNSG